MRNLSTVRAGWDEIAAEETRLLRELTVAEGIRQLTALHRAFEPQLRETENLFRADRTAYLIKLQQRLSRLAEWRGEYRVENLVQSLPVLTSCWLRRASIWASFAALRQLSCSQAW